MGSAAIPVDSPELSFARSDSKVVGMGGTMMDKLRDNAPRVVAGLKMMGDIAAGLTLDPFLMTYAGFSIAGRLISIVYGSKSNQQKSAPGAVPLGDSWKDGLTKVMHPRQYPVESSAGLSVVGESFTAAFGASQFFEPGKTGYTALIGGLIAMWAYANIVFGKETSKEDKAKEAKESLTFGKSESKPVGIIGRVKDMMKGNPLLVSSLLQLGVVTAVLIGSLVESYKPAYVAYAIIGIVACTVQALFVRKNDFNIEGAQAEKKEALKPPTFEDKLVQKRQSGGAGLQPA